MKLVNISVSALALLSAAAGYSAGLSVQGEVISSQSKLDLGKGTLHDLTGGTSEAGKIEEKSERIMAPGFGVSLQYQMNDALRLGGGFAYADYDAGKDKTQYTDMSVAANASYDFYKREALALYGLGGLSYHMVDPKDIKSDDFNMKRDSTSLVNYDLGLGGRYAVAENVSLSLGYRFSDTLAKGTLDSKLAAISSPTSGAKAKTKDVTMQKNELIASVGYSF